MDGQLWLDDVRERYARFKRNIERAAAQVWMTAVLLDDPVGRDAIVYDRDGWDGAAIRSLAEVCELVEARQT